jgi:hypothetical protein
MLKVLATNLRTDSTVNAGFSESAEAADESPPDLLTPVHAFKNIEEVAISSKILIASPQSNVGKARINFRNEA